MSYLSLQTLLNPRDAEQNDVVGRCWMFLELRLPPVAGLLGCWESASMSQLGSAIITKLLFQQDPHTQLFHSMKLAYTVSVREMVCVCVVVGWVFTDRLRWGSLLGQLSSPCSLLSNRAPSLPGSVSLAMTDC